jgi:hypothetical protein
MQQAAKSTNPIVTSLYLHVQTVNEKAIRFYRRNGFRIQSIVPDYYKYIEHKDAYILTRPIFNTSHQLPLQPLPQIQIQPQQQQQQQQHQ